LYEIGFFERNALHSYSSTISAGFVDDGITPILDLGGYRVGVTFEWQKQYSLM